MKFQLGGIPRAMGVGPSLGLDCGGVCLGQFPPSVPLINEVRGRITLWSPPRTPVLVTSPGWLVVPPVSHCVTKAELSACQPALGWLTPADKCTGPFWLRDTDMSSSTNKHVQRVSQVGPASIFQGEAKGIVWTLQGSCMHGYGKWNNYQAMTGVFFLRSGPMDQ